MLMVIWALGWAMIALAALCWLPLPAILAFGVAMIAGHNLLDGVRSTHPIWVMLHSQGVVVNQPGFVVFVAYPWCRGSASPRSASSSAGFTPGTPSGVARSCCAAG